MEKKSIYTICISVIVGFLVLGVFTYYGLTNSHNVQSNDLPYQIITHGDSLIVFDKKTGDYWQKFSQQNIGPTKWEKFSVPIE